MQKSFFDEDELQNLLNQLDTEKIATSIEANETEEMKAAEKRYEDYILKHKSNEKSSEKQ